MLKGVLYPNDLENHGGGYDTPPRPSSKVACALVHQMFECSFAAVHPFVVLRFRTTYAVSTL